MRQFTEDAPLKKTASSNADTRYQQDEAGSQLGANGIEVWAARQI